MGDGEYYIDSIANGCSDVNELLWCVIDYYGDSIRKINDNCYDGNGPDSYWDTTMMEWSFCVNAYMTLLKQITSTDYDYVNDLTKDLNRYYNDLIRGYGEAIRKDPKSTASEYFLCAIGMMEDLIDYIYCVIGLSID